MKLFGGVIYSHETKSVLVTFQRKLIKLHDSIKIRER